MTWFTECIISANLHHTSNLHFRVMNLLSVLPGYFHFSQYCLDNSLHYLLIFFKEFSSFLVDGLIYSRIGTRLSWHVVFQWSFLMNILLCYCPSAVHKKSKCISFRHWHQLSKGQKIPFISFWAVKVVNCKCCYIFCNEKRKIDY